MGKGTDLYRWGAWSDDEGVSFYSIDKKRWWGWKEITYWTYDGWGSNMVASKAKAKVKCLAAVEEMRKSGFMVIEN